MDTRASEPKIQGPKSKEESLTNACAAAANELAKTLLFAAALERENELLNQRLATEKEQAALLTKLTASRKSEVEALQTTLAAKNETITAKDSVIAGQDKLIAALKTKKTSPWKRIGDVLIGVAISALLK